MGGPQALLRVDSFGYPGVGGRRHPRPLVCSLLDRGWVWRPGPHPCSEPVGVGTAGETVRALHQTPPGPSEGPRVTLDHATPGRLTGLTQDLRAEGCSGLLCPWPEVPPRSPGPGLALSGSQSVLAEGHAAMLEASSSTHRASWTAGNGTPPAIPPSTGPHCPRPCGFLWCLSALRLGGRRSEGTGAAQETSKSGGQEAPDRGC